MGIPTSLPVLIRGLPGVMLSLTLVELQAAH
jgi:hypothetical protein